jgi:DNA-binding transcriptional LysR family regulator
MDKFRAMKTFVQIVETGSLTAAANALNTSLPTVVRALAALEHQLGVSLLNRTTRRIHLTDEGARYLERCRVILSEIQETEDTLASRQAKPQGKLTVTASVLFGRRYIAPILSEFLQRHPHVSADLLLLDRVVNLVDEGVDVGIRIAHLKDSSLVVESVGQVRRVVCASEQYLRRHGIPRGLNDIRKHRCVRHLGLVPQSEWHFLVGKRNVTIPIISVFTSNEIDAALNACLTGLGLGMFLSYMVESYRSSGDVRYVLEQFEPGPVPIQIVYPHSKLLSSRTRAFVDECVVKLKQVKFD